ncbi:hypothetical protein C1I97_22570 [Streptomyces sp. NTH33]|uniref:nuclear transport factor 2 family protein n=1 Tax=Streptomyces sp. NTH33 TaxID=1735453 RepID=UPI000DA9EDDA|nr:nuclear transport factor 2 family protein [Streptomyces sp. NTH33]PZH01136.1 hypothetical protein C1I97_22570 [Streptomyces sp. NTH33]
MTPPNATDDLRETASERSGIDAVFTAFRTAWQSRDQAALAGCFTPGAQAHLSHLGRFTDASEIAAALLRSTAETDLTRYRATNSYTAVSGTTAQQSAYLLGTLADERADGALDALLFGGHFVNTYVRTPEGWRIDKIRFDLDWQHGNRDHARGWSFAGRTPDWPDDRTPPAILSELDAPWHTVPRPTEQGSAEEQVAEAYIRYAWALDQADFGLLTTAFTADAKADLIPFGKLNSGRDIVAALKELRMGQPSMQHAAGDFQVKVSGDRATMDVFRVVPFAPTKETLDARVHGARYESRLRRENGLWKFDWLDYIPGWVQSAEHDRR